MTPIPFDNSYARLPQQFYTRTNPTPVRAPRLVRLNRALALDLGLDPEALAAEGAEIFSGNRIPEGAEPIAQAYAGHQFGSFVPRLGDGRAILLGEVVDRSGTRRDLQLKGAGRTPWSRGGDGRAAVGPVLREYVVSEAMAALGIRTTRSLAVVTTGETVIREELLPGAVLTRVASSHLRVGTFEYFATSRRDRDSVKLLADHVLARHYPEAARAERPYRALLDAVIAAQAELIASWLLVGFIHGVMNTDNMSVAGETIDYGPCAFMDEYDPNTVFSSIDRYGRYAYGNQPAIGGWNLSRFAETLLPLLADDAESAVADANEALAGYSPTFERAYVAGLRRKLGLFSEDEGDLALAQELLALMHASRADFTLTFRALGDAAAGETALRASFTDPAAYDQWEQRWRRRLEQEETDPAARREAIRRVNPAFIPRNHRVEAVIRAAVDEGDFAPFEELTAVLARPFDDQPERAEYAQPPQEEERVLQTFCGT